MSTEQVKLRTYSEEEKKMWRRHNIESLLESASLSFTEKIKILEGLAELARSMHGGKLPRSPDEHEEQRSEDFVKS